HPSPCLPLPLSPSTLFYTLSLHDALPISLAARLHREQKASCDRIGDRQHRRSGHARSSLSSPALRMPASCGRTFAPKRKLYLARSEEHTSELQSHLNLVCRLLLEKKKINK